MSEAMSAEFDTVAEWTARVALDLGEDYFIPAGCRGSGSPAALDWLIDHLDLAAGETLLDCGAGIGGPAAYAVRARSVEPVLVEPEAGACRASRALFDYPVTRADASALPIADESVCAGWALGVLCTTETQLSLLREMRRVVRPPGRIGLLVLVAREPVIDDHPEGNHFPTVEVLEDLIARAGLRIDAWRGTGDLGPVPDEWNERVDAVTARLGERYGGERAWRQAEEQSDRIGKALSTSAVTSELVSLRRLD
ncbi:SAM-dependent methyltransferase [Mycobacterium antarcticum]|uniref:class I SAM-dependent methyltransferase n=1 Tax=Mycolicibacterium sp. TUM20983 TaxID=3023369 RepID=UPI002393DFE1|nr:methyltransferase domain-containing protein [Mycolicibacterium sp. TUM20983]GLP77980.1 SAM-dependent methyltransferase [Mycolicibacterium sp. TUM20983]